MAVTSAPQRVRPRTGRDARDWWLDAPNLLQAIERKPATAQFSGSYRLGNVSLEIVADDLSLHEAFRELYGDCIEANAGPATRKMRCTLRRG